MRDENESAPEKRRGQRVTVVAIDDNLVDLQGLEYDLRFLEVFDCRVHSLPSLDLALQLLSEIEPTVIFLDDRMGPRDRAETSIALLAQAGVIAPIIVMTSPLSPARRDALMRLGCIEAVDKDRMDAPTLETLLSMATSPSRAPKHR